MLPPQKNDNLQMLHVNHLERLQLILKFDWIGILNKLMATNKPSALRGFQKGWPLIFFSQHICRVASKEILTVFALVTLDNAMQIGLK